MPDILVNVQRRLTENEIGPVIHLLDNVSRADTITAVSEDVLLRLRTGQEAGEQYLLAYVAGKLAGFASLNDQSASGDQVAEVAVHPDFRRRGVATRLLSNLEKDVHGRLLVWAHGNRPAAIALARQHGFLTHRSLWQMRRSLQESLPIAPLPPDVQVRPFVVGQDEDAWIRLNAAAFAHHPEQGNWMEADLRTRELEPWFDPEGFLLAERIVDHELVGFHWTKIHGRQKGQPAIGEVYVLGVRPGRGRQGLGFALTVAGLRYLRARGLSEAMLYVDETNTSAVALYQRLGFSLWQEDVQYEHVSRQAPT